MEPNSPTVLREPAMLADSRRGSPALRQAAVSFWAALGGKSESDTMTQQEYRFVHVRISKALAPELSAEDARAAADEDWAEDLGDDEAMTFDHFVEGLLGIAHQWIDARCDELLHAVFLNQLLRRLTVEIDGLCQRVYLPLVEITHLTEAAIAGECAASLAQWSSMGSMRPGLQSGLGGANSRCDAGRRLEEHEGIIWTGEGSRGRWQPNAPATLSEAREAACHLPFDSPMKQRGWAKTGCARGWRGWAGGSERHFA